MKEFTIQVLAQILSANQGNRITNELSTGILTSLNQALSSLPQNQDQDAQVDLSVSASEN